MWIRFKRLSQLTPFTPAKAMMPHAQRAYLFTTEAAGLVFVPHQTDIEYLLRGGTDGSAPEYELAYEKHGVRFDAAGLAAEPSATGSAPTTEHVDVTTPTTTTSTAPTTAIEPPSRPKQDSPPPQRAGRPKTR